MTRTPPLRRLLASAAALVVGAAGALAFASPASATYGKGYDVDMKLRGSVECVDGVQTVTWKVKNKAHPKWGDAEVKEIGSDAEPAVDGIAEGDDLERNQWYHATQTFDGTADGTVTLDVELKWEKEHRYFWTKKKHKSASTEVDLPGDCRPDFPDPGNTGVEWGFDCTQLELWLYNNGDHAWEYTVVTSVDDVETVALDAGESTAVTFPSASGLTVDVLIDGQSVLGDQELTITEEDWSTQECDYVPPEPDGLLQVSYDCEAIAVVVENTTDAEWTYDLVFNEDAPTTVTVPAGEESEPVGFEAAAGSVVDVLVDGESILSDGPYVLTEEMWGELECDTGGGGGELPDTGSTTALAAGGAAVLLALGGGLYLLARRRRVIFTA